MDRSDRQSEGAREEVRERASALFGESDITVDIVIRMFWPDKQVMCVSFLYILILRTLTFVASVHAREQVALDVIPILN